MQKLGGLSRIGAKINIRQKSYKFKREFLRLIRNFVSYALDAFVFLIFLINYKHSPEQRFQNIYRFIIGNPRIFKTKAELFRSYPQSWQNYIFLDILKIFKYFNIEFCPKIIPIHHSRFLELANSDRPLVIVGLHSEISTCFNRLAESLGITWAVITSSLEVSKRSKLFGLKGDLLTVPNSAESFLRARQLIKHGTVIFCCPDFESTDWTNLNTCFCVSLGIFEFSHRINAEIIYVRPTIDKSGDIYYEFSDAISARSFESANFIANHFVNYMKEFAETNVDWQIRANARA